MTRSWLFTAIVCVLSPVGLGCSIGSSLKVPPSECEAVALPLAEHPPSKSEIAEGQMRVVTTHFADRSSRALADRLVTATEQQLSIAGVQVVDRATSKNLLGEVQLAEQKGARARYKGPEVADFVVVVRLDSADSTGEYIEAGRIDKGNVFDTPQCKLAGLVTGGLRIYRVPDLVVVKLVELQGSASKMVASSSRNCEPRADSAWLERRAGEVALELSQENLKNVFAPKGYVLEHRRCDGTDLFKVSIGSERGLKPEDRVEIYTLKIALNALTGIGNIEEERVATGRVSGRVGANYAWIVDVKDDDVPRIRLGDYIEVVYKPGGARQWFRDAFGSED